MDRKKSLVGKVSFDVEYALNPISSFREYVDIIAGIWATMGDEVSKSHILISQNGECVSDKSASDYGVEFANSKMLMDESVAREVSKKMGYLFFPSGKITDNKFHRSFALEDFIKGAEGILENINHETTHNNRSYKEFVADGIKGMKKDSMHFNNEVVLGYNINSPNITLVAPLKEEYIGGLEAFSTRGFGGAWAKMDVDSSHNSNGFFRANEFRAQFFPRKIDKDFSEQDLLDIEGVLYNVSEGNKNARELKKGYDENVSLQMNNKDKSLLDLRFCMYDVEDFTRVLSAGEMIGPFSKYLHLVYGGLQVIADTKKNKRNARIARLESAIGVLNK